jgi:prepilin-type N-terminal cleavage/methylation domain-containing protein
MGLSMMEKNLFLPNKKGFTLIEIIFSITISSIILFSALNILKVLNQQNEKTFTITITKIDFETTRLFLEQKIQDDSTLSNLTLKETILFYNGNPLIKDITSFTKTNETNGINIDICKKGGFCTRIYIVKKPKY